MFRGLFLQGRRTLDVMPFSTEEPDASINVSEETAVSTFRVTIKM
jgi:hypothetical protein